MKNCYRFFANRECEFYPCHKSGDSGEFNCLFCYCPLYALAENCGGNFCFLADGTKDCSNCLLPHSKEGYDYIMSKYNEIAKLACKKQEE